MHRLPVRPVVGVLVGLAVSRAQAQSRFELSPFASRNSSLEGSPVLVGASLTSCSARRALYSSTVTGIARPSTCVTT